jgi:hypothetical protein
MSTHGKFFETRNNGNIAQKVFSSYNLLDKLITYVKDEGGNLSTLARALNFMVKCVSLVLVTPWQGLYFDHVFNKTYRYACNDTNACLGF